MQSDLQQSSGRLLQCSRLSECRGCLIWIGSKPETLQPSDLDLACEGLPAARFFEALGRLLRTLPIPVDLIDLEEPGLTADTSFQGFTGGDHTLMRKTHLTRLQSEIETEWPRLEMLVQELQQLVANLPAHAEPSRRDKAAIGAFLHSFYNGIENILKHLAREIDQNVPTGEGWHRALLQRMSVAVPGIRSAVLRPDTVLMLEPYMVSRGSWGMCATSPAPHPVASGTSRQASGGP